jgi:hypothetical protein
LRRVYDNVRAGQMVFSGDADVLAGGHGRGVRAFIGLPILSLLFYVLAVGLGARWALGGE